MKEGIVRYVKIVKYLFTAFAVVDLTAFMVSMVFAFNRYFAFYFISPALLVAFLVAYGFYAMRVSMGTVIGVEVTPEVVHIKTKRKTYTYDAQTGCEKITVSKNKFVGTFSDQKSRDKFIFYRRVPFSKYREEAFTEAEIMTFYPRIAEEEIGMK